MTNQSDIEHKHAKEEKIIAGRKKILESVSSFTTNTMKEKVAYLLSSFPETRNSDIALLIKYWETFCSDIYDPKSFHPKDLFQLPTHTSITRNRQIIQNTYNLFQASPEIKEYRGKLSEEEKQEYFSAKQRYPMFNVYIDESGKTDKQLIIGSIWLLSDQRIVKDIWNPFQEHKKEYHFKNISKGNINDHIEFVNLFWQNMNAFSYKFISITRAGIKDQQQALTYLYYHLLIKGIEHESSTGRARLPRTLNAWIDQEGTSLDQIRKIEIEDKLKDSARNRFEDQLRIQNVDFVDSRKNPMIQLADLFTSSINRIINCPGNNQKDEFAIYVTNKLKIDPTLPNNEKLEDYVFHISYGNERT